MVGLVAVLVCVALAPQSTSCAWAADGKEAAPDNDPADKSDDDNDGDDDDGKSSTKTGGSSFFPGVRGISGKELERIIRDRERKKKEEERKRRRHGENRRPPAEEPESAPRKETRNDPAKSDPDREKPNAPATPAATRPENSVAPETLLKGVALTGDAKAYLKKLLRRTAHTEWFFEEAHGIRDDAEKDAAAVGNEVLVHYILQFTNRRTKLTRAYQRKLKLPLTVYATIYGQTVSTVAYARNQGPEDLPKPAVTVVEACIERLKFVRAGCLLATAELYTALRQLPAAEKIYTVLLKEFPKDRPIRRSHQEFLAVKMAKRPTTPPGVSTGGGNSGRHYRDRDNNGGGEDGDDSEPYSRRYSR
jgi:hypothetical protein